MGNGSGQKRMVINTRERLVGDDHNRSRDFSAAQVGDVLHALFDPRGGSLDTGNAATLNTKQAGPIETPVQASVLDGLMVVAPLGSTELSVTPGVVTLVDVDGLPGSASSESHSGDDSVAKVVVAAGVIAGSGTLTFTSNASGSVRVDLVEVRRLPNVSLEVDSREVFDSATGLFPPTPVAKVVQDRLEYRIRLGTPGAGLPPAAQGWLPIAVVGVAVGAASFDQCDLYDVRPLVRDRVNVFTASINSAPPSECDLQTDSRTGAGERRLFGIFQSELFGYRAGGRLGWSHAGVDQPWIDLMNPQFREAGFASVANQIVYLWLAFPGGLPRWVRYTRTAVAPFGGRVPSGMYGVPVLSTTPPLGANGTIPAAPIAMPPGSALQGATASSGLVLLASAMDQSNAPSTILVRDRRLHFTIDASLPTNGVPSIAFAPVASTTLEDHYELVFGTHIPKNARRVLLVLATKFTGTPGAELTYAPTAVGVDPLATAFDQVMHEPHAPGQAGAVPASGEFSPRFSEWVDLPTMVPTTAAYAAVDRHRVRVAWAQSQTKDATASSCTVVGWET